MRRLGAQLVRFVVVGVVCTGLQYLALALGVELVGAPAVTASGAGFLASAGLNYLLNRRFTFGGVAPHARAIGRFVLVVGAGLALNTLFMQLLHGYLGWQYLLAQVATTAVTTLWNFTAHRQYTFAAVREEPGTRSVPRCD